MNVHGAKTACNEPKRHFLQSHLIAMPHAHTGSSTLPQNMPVAVRAPRFADYLIAATALAAGLPLYTRNPGDFAHLDHLLKIVNV